MVKLHDLKLYENEYGVNAEIVIFSNKKFRIEIKTNVPIDDCGIERAEFAQAIAKKALNFAENLEENYNDKND